MTKIWKLGPARAGMRAQKDGQRLVGMCWQVWNLRNLGEENRGLGLEVHLGIGAKTRMTLKISMRVSSRFAMILKSTVNDQISRDDARYAMRRLDRPGKKWECRNERPSCDDAMRCARCDGIEGCKVRGR